MPTLWTWQPGRQGSGYDIFTLLWSTRLRLDCYLIRYRAGGELACEHSLLRIGPLNVFRPDLALHAVSEVTRGTRIVFSIGWKTGRAHDLPPG